MKKLLLLAAVAVLTINVDLWGQSITVTSPTTGNQWCPGTTYTITWTKSGTMPATVAVRLRRMGAPETEAAVMTITASTANDGSLSWAIPTSGLEGYYFIRVRTTSPAVVGNSGIVFISACSPRLTLPITPIVLPRGVISGRISGRTPSNYIRDHRVRVVLKKGGRLVKADVYLLDAEGSCNYQFTNLLLGTYEITVEKAPGLRLATLNPCFHSTTPAVYTVPIASATPNATGKDFLIKWVTLLGIDSDCW